MKLALLLLLVVVQAKASELPREIGDALKKSGISQDHVGIYVRDVSKKNPAISWRADNAMSPASTMKLVTSYAALSILGPAYTWKTEAYIPGKIVNGALDGPLILKGYGDPRFDIERIRLFVDDMRARGLKDIRGGLVLDRSYFSTKENPGNFDNRPYRPYNVTPDALLANFEATSLKFVPNEKGIEVIAEPDFGSLSITNALTPSQDPCGDWEDRISSRIESDGKRARLHLSGEFPMACGEKEDSLALYDHSEYLYQLFSRLWMASGGKIDGAWREGPAPLDAKLFAVSESPPLSSVVIDMNKFSNNVMARQMFLTIGALNNPPGTEQSADGAVKAWLRGRGLSFSELVIENGSGLSRMERISARHLGELLEDAYNSPIMPTFFASLPIAGIDGTMKKRLKNTPVEGRAWIKTGALEETRAIAGIIQTQSGKRFVVVCFVNDREAAKAKPAQDELLEWIESSL